MLTRRPAQDQHHGLDGHDDYRALLTSVGVDVEALGSRISRCPMCSDHRKKKNEKCLSVKVDADGYVFRCHHCSWHGGSTRYTPAGRREPPTSRRDDQPSTIDAAARIWREGVDPRGTVSDQYLASSRRLPLPPEICGGVVRFHPALYLKGHDRRVPGMLTLMRNIRTDQPQAIQRTFLADDGSKIARWMYGPAGDAAIKISAGEDVTGGLFIGEGFETCLRAYLAGFRPTWAVGSVSSIAKFPVLGGIEALTILGEKNDGINDDGKNVAMTNVEASQECADRWIEAGCEVIFAEPLTGDDFDDAMREAAP